MFGTNEVFNEDWDEVIQARTEILMKKGVNEASSPSKDRFRFT